MQIEVKYGLGTYIEFKVAQAVRIGKIAEVRINDLGTFYDLEDHSSLVKEDEVIGSFTRTPVKKPRARVTKSAAAKIVLNKNEAGEVGIGFPQEM